VNGLKTELAGSLEVVTVNMYTDTGRTLSAEYSAFGTPTFIFFDADGEEQWRQIGSIDSARVQASVYGN